jgi:chemotaxis protein methyltransferase WspC
MNMAPISELLRQRIGLEADSLGVATLAHAVGPRLRALNLATPEAYAARLAEDGQEFQLLLGEVLVPETWFFRGGELFTYLAGHVADTVRVPSLEKQTFRILSVPCSTGEEPYSLAIALEEAGVAPAAWEIEAVDLSPKHLAQAQKARFSNFAFRQTASALRDRYFQLVEGSWELQPCIRARVRFRQGNLLDPFFLASEAPFDLILCRNLFIYLHAEARRRVLITITRLLAAGGWLCTGHADAFAFRELGFTPTGPASYFLYRRETEEDERVMAGAKEVVKEPLVPTTSPPRQLDDALTRARREADRGRLAEALASCQEQLTQFGPSADLYSLMGIIHQARQETAQAVHCYQRALYLEREHAEALAHWMLLSRQQGDEAQAERLRRRLERAALGK